MSRDSKKFQTNPNMRRVFATTLVFLCSLLAAVLFWQRSHSAHGQARSTLLVRSASFSNNGPIPRQYTCDGASLSPQLSWQATPASTKSLAIVMEDPDAPVLFTHWLVYNLAPNVRDLTEGASRQGIMPEGHNSFGRLGYGGPCPPPGKPHHYIFRVYALDRQLDLPAGASRQQLDTAIDDHIVGQGQIVGIYQRMSR
ncbi:MAG: YbhB/YbcL family Raf kinase inhibitor-like protein [Terracidiphilus sp.]